MPVCRIDGVRIAGLASAAPRAVYDNRAAADRFGAEEVEKIIQATGVRCRRVAPEGMCTSDLCLAAADRLLNDLAWERASVDAVILVTQSADYTLPATSCLLQSRLGLSTACAAMDITLGCSGYIYGLWTAASLVKAGGCRRVLLLVGETATRRVNPLDRSAVLLFGDAGTATALELASPDAPADAMHFVLGTDGAGGEHLVIPAGGCRMPVSTDTMVGHRAEDGNVRSLGELHMNGVEIFLFTNRQVPPLVRQTLQAADWTLDSVDAVVLHQANEFMLKHVARALKLPAEKMPLCLDRFGNTSSATVPLTMTTELGERLRERSCRLLLAGFGVGLSWAAVALTLGPMTVSPLVEVDEAGTQPAFFGQSA